MLDLITRLEEQMARNENEILKLKIKEFNLNTELLKIRLEKIRLKNEILKLILQS